jgi:CheY-like chemotaxis protein
MGAPNTLLCIHRNPAELGLLQQGGYKLVTATNGRDGLRLFMTRPVDAILLEYHLGFLDGGIVAAEIKKVKPDVPILMLIDHLDVPDGALKSVDMVVAKVDGDGFLLSAVHSVLNREPIAAPSKASAQPAPATLPRRDDARNDRFSPEAWRSILNGTIRFRSGEGWRRNN